MNAECHAADVIVYAVVDGSLSDSSPLGDAIETFVHREDGERFIEEVRGDDPELVALLARAGTAHRPASASRRRSRAPALSRARPPMTSSWAPMAMM
jgi:hypothetical protein